MSLYQKIQIHVPLYGLLKKVPSPDNMARALIICDDALGDLLLLSGVLKYLHDRGYRITLVVRDTWKDLARHMWATRIIPVQTNLYKQSLRYRKEILNQVRQEPYSWAAAALFPSALNADILTYCGAPKRYGYKWGNSWHERKRLWGANHTIASLSMKISPRLHEDMTALLAHYYAAILAEPLSSKDIQPSLNPIPAPAWPSVLEKTDYLLFISDTMDKIRQYPADKLLPVIANYAQQQGWKVVVTGKSENPAIPALPGVINLTGKTSLQQLNELIFHARVVVGNETGSTHLAWIWGRPTVMLLGGGHFGLFRPAKNCQLVYQPMSCYGCSWDTCPHTSMQQTAPCVLAITPQQILQALQRIDSGEMNAVNVFEQEK